MLYFYIALGITIFILLVVVLFIVVFRIHNKAFNKRFMPNPLVKFYTKEEFNLDYEKIEIKYNDETIAGGLYSYGEYDNDKLIIFCHGMESCKESYMQEIGYIAQKGFLVLGFDYLGTNESTGLIKGFGTSLKSLDIVINYIKSNDKLKNKKIYVVGHSWGGYASTNIVSLHNDIEGIVALAPALNFYRLLRSVYKINPFFARLVVFVDKIKLGKYSNRNGLKSLKKYNGKILIIQSKDDNRVKFDTSLGLIKKELNDKAEYIILEDRMHNPDYKKESVDYLNEFLNNVFKYSGEEQIEYMKNQNYHKMGELDPVVMDGIINFLKK